MDIEFSDEVTEQRQRNLQLRIQNTGFALLMLTRNSKLLRMLKSKYPTLLYDIRNSHSGSDDILDAALLAALNQWTTGVKELRVEVETVFSKLLLTEKMAFTLKMFSILKHNKHSLTHQSIQVLLSMPKIRTYVQWQ